MAKLDRRSAGGQDLICWQHQALEASIAWIVSDANVNLATLQHGSLVSTKGLGQFHVHVGKALSVSGQERRQDAFDRMRRGGNLQHPPVATAGEFDPFAQRLDMAHYAATIAEELLALCSQHQAASNAVKESQPQLLLEIADLSREGGLPDAQAQRCFRHRAQLGYGDKGAQAPQV